jgi:hypothetical protein
MMRQLTGINDHLEHLTRADTIMRVERIGAYPGREHGQQSGHVYLD